MAQIDSYRSTLNTRMQELSRLQQEKVREQKKLSDLKSKINSVTNGLSRTSASSIKSKLNEIARLEANSATLMTKLATLESKISKKHKDVADLQNKIEKEQSKEAKREKQNLDRLHQDQQRTFSNINITLHDHDRRHTETMNAINDLRNTPEKIVVLFLASNPIDQVSLRLDQEAREITEMIGKSKHRDSIRFQTCWAVRPKDILQAINEHKPSIIHFSGHGSENDEIIFETESGQTKVVTKEAIVQTMMASSDEIRLVFFNTCYSRNQAVAVVKHVEAAIGMQTSIGDKAALVFSSQFYSSLGFGLSLEKAFEQAKALLMLEDIPEEETPELFVREGLIAKEIFIIKP